MKSIINTIKEWVKAPYNVGIIGESKMQLGSFLALGGVVLSISSFLYLKSYFDEFKINYFYYFSVTDGLSVLYQMAESVYYLLILSTIVYFASIVPLLLIKSQALIERKLATNGFVIVSAIIFIFLFSIAINVFVRNYFNNGAFYDTQFIGVLAILVFLTLFLSRNSIYYTFLIVPVLFQKRSVSDADMIKANPIQQTIEVKILSKGTTVVFDGESNLFIQRTDKYLFYKDLKRDTTVIVPIADVGLTLF